MENQHGDSRGTKRKKEKVTKDHGIMTSALGGGESSASRSRRFTPREGIPITH
jgi:hypothetical protein